MPVLAHRLLPTAQAQLNRRTAEQVVQEILRRTPVPTSPDSVATAPRVPPYPQGGPAYAPGARRP